MKPWHIRTRKSDHVVIASGRVFSAFLFSLDLLSLSAKVFE